MVGTMAPVPQVVDAVRVPVIAPAASPTDEGLAAAFALGASGAQLQTISGLPGRNCCAAPSLATAQGPDDSTELTRAFIGRPARALRNRFIVQMGCLLQASVVGPLWQVHSDAARAVLMPFWAGQAAPLLRELPAQTARS